MGTEAGAILFGQPSVKGRVRSRACILNGRVAEKLCSTISHRSMALKGVINPIGILISLAAAKGPIA